MPSQRNDIAPLIDSLRDGGPRRILLAMDNRQDRNWGSQATTNALVDLLRTRFPEAKIRGVPRSATSPGKPLRYLCERLGPRILERQDWSSKMSRLALFLTTFKWSKAAAWADLVIVNGEGTLRPQNQAFRWLPALSWIQQQTKSPMWIVNSSISFQGSSYQRMFERFLSCADYIALREPISFSQVVGAGFDAVQASDCAFLATPKSSSRVDELATKLGDFVVLTGSSSIDRWPEEIQRQLVSSLQSQGLSVVYATSTTVDDRNYRRHHSHLPLISSRDYDYQELMEIQSRSKLLVGGRFHPTIFAAVTGTPFVSIGSNSHKTLGLMQMLGTENLLVPFDDLSVQIAAVNGALARSEEHANSLKGRAKQCAELALRNVPVKAISSQGCQ